MRRLPLASAVLCLALAALLADPPKDESPFVAAWRARLDIETKIREATRTKISFDMTDEPLDKAVKTLAAKAGIQNVRLDTTALMEEGIANDEPITRKLSDVSLKSAFDVVLEPLGLTWRIEDEMLVVTTRIKNDDFTSHRFVDIRELRKAFAAVPESHRRKWRERFEKTVGVFNDPGDYPEDVRDLIMLLFAETEGPWQDIDGSGGTISSAGTSLVIRQTERVHDESAIVLQNVLAFTRRKPSLGMTNLNLSAAEQEAWRKLWEALARPVGPLEFQETPVKEVVARLAEVSGANFVIDDIALMEEGINSDEPVTFSSGKMTLRSAASTILSPLGLTLIVQSEVFKVTTEVKADETMSTCLYDVRELLDAGVDEMALADLIEFETEGPWETLDGSGGTLGSPLPGAFVIRQTAKVHGQIAELIAEVASTFHEGKGSGALVRLKAEAASAEPVLRFYALDRKGLAAQMETAIVEFVAPESWTAGGGKGTIRRVEETLVVRQSAAVHEQIASFLRDFKKAEDNPVLDKPRAPRGF